MPIPYTKNYHLKSSAKSSHRFVCCTTSGYLQISAVSPWDTTTVLGMCHCTEPFHFINPAEKQENKKTIFKKYLKKSFLSGQWAEAAGGISRKCQNCHKSKGKKGWQGTDISPCRSKKHHITAQINPSSHQESTAPRPFGSPELSSTFLAG